MIHDHGPQEYSPEFRLQAVELYKSTPGATLRGISADLGVSRHTLYDWVHADDTPTTATTTASGGAATGSRRTGRPQAPSGPSGPEAEIAALRARVAALETERADDDGGAGVVVGAARAADGRARG